MLTGQSKADNPSLIIFPSYSFVSSWQFTPTLTHFLYCLVFSCVCINFCFVFSVLPMYACVMSVCMCMYMCVYVSMWKYKANVGRLADYSPFLLSCDLSLHPDLPSFGLYTYTACLGITCLCVPRVGISGGHHACLVFIWVLNMRITILMLVWPVLLPLISPSLDF